MLSLSWVEDPRYRQRKVIMRTEIEWTSTCQEDEAQIGRDSRISKAFPVPCMERGLSAWIWRQGIA